MNDKFARYMEDPYLSDLMAYYNLNSELDHDRLWIIDAVASAPLPLHYSAAMSQSRKGRPYYINLSTTETSWEHPFDSFYLRFLDIQEETLSKHQMTAQERALSRRPPRMIRDVLSMAAYYGLSPDDWPLFWTVLVAISCDLKQLKWRFSAETSLWQSAAFEGVWHPIDLFLQQLCVESLACQHPYLIPLLTPVESQITQPQRALVWDFRQMRCYIVPEASTACYRTMRPPTLQRIDDFLSQNEQIDCFDMDNFSRNQRIFPIELYAAWESAGGASGSGRAFQGLRKTHNAADDT